MKKTHLLLIAALAVVLTLAFATSAFAETRVELLPDGTLATSEIVVTGVDHYKDPKTGKIVGRNVSGGSEILAPAVASSGTGGYKATSGTRDAYIRTTYSFWGQNTCYFQSFYYFAFVNGKVTSMANNGRKIWCNNNMFYNLITYQTGGPVTMTWNGVYGGQNKCWQSATIRAQAPLVGGLWEYRPYHEMFAHGDGTWYWTAN